MRLLTITDNVVYGQGLFAEHGLSFWVEAGGKKILFDSGQSGEVLLKNAKALGVDLKSADLLVLSHGHYDHTGGMDAFLKLNPSARVIYGKGAMEAKYSLSTGKRREIGCPWKERLDKYTNDMSEIDNDTEICDNVRIITNIPRFNDFEEISPTLLVKKDRKYIPDEFRDELFLLIREGNDCHVVTGCSHHGIINIMDAAKEACPRGVLRSISGGSHLRGASNERIGKTIEAFKSSEIEHIGINHCTGVDAFAEVRAGLGERVRYLSVGSELKF